MEELEQSATLVLRLSLRILQMADLPLVKSRVLLVVRPWRTSNASLLEPSTFAFFESVAQIAIRQSEGEQFVQKEKRVLDRLRRSSLYKDYEQAYTASTKLPLTLRPMEYWQVPHEGQPQQWPNVTRPTMSIFYKASPRSSGPTSLPDFIDGLCPSV